MGLWKIALGILVGVALTKVGRQTLTDFGKLVFEKGQCIADKSCSTFDDLEAKAGEFVEELKSGKKVDPGNPTTDLGNSA